MIRLIEGDVRNFYPREIEAMHKNRAEVFHGRLGWDVTVDVLGWEVDRFDECNPLYLISLDEDENYQGSTRLLPTTGPNMLRDVFPQLLQSSSTMVGGDSLCIEEVVESATIWEASRICAAPGKAISVLQELVAGIAQVVRDAGLTQIVSVFDERMLTLLKRAGCRIDILGTPQIIGGIMCYAGLFADHDQITEIIAKAGGNVLEGTTVLASACTAVML